MKTLKRMWLIVTFIGCCYVLVSGYLSLDNSSSSMKDFILGRWINKSPGTYNNETSKYTYQLEFLKSGVVIYNRSEGNYPLNNVQMDYQLLGENKVILRGRVIEELNIDRDGGVLLIKPDELLVKGGRYYRAPKIEWWIIAILSTFALINFGYFYLPRCMLDVKKIKSTFFPKSIDWKKVTGLIVCGFIYTVIFFVGWMVALKLWRSGFMANILLPWDAILSFELGLGILFLVMFLISYSLRKSQEQATIIRLGILSIPVFLLGAGAMWILFGLFRFAIFTIWGKYPG